MVLPLTNMRGKARKIVRPATISSRTEAVEGFTKLGGDPEFLAWLEGFLPKDLSANWKNNAPDAVVRAARRFRDEIRRSRLPLSSAVEADRVSRQIELEAKRFQNELARSLRNLFHGPPKRGHPLEHPDIYGWLGSLLPYTAQINTQVGDPAWDWIEGWLVIQPQHANAPSGRKAWGKSVAGRIRERKAVAPAVRWILKTAAAQFLVFGRWTEIVKRRARSRAATGHTDLLVRKVYERPWNQKEMKYLRAVQRFMPFLDIIFQGAKNLSELQTRLGCSMAWASSAP